MSFETWSCLAGHQRRSVIRPETMSIASNANVYNTCLQILRQRGFALRLDYGRTPANNLLQSTADDKKLDARIR